MDRPLFDSLLSAMRWAWYGSVDAGNTVKGPAWAQYQKTDERDQIADEKPEYHNPDVGGVPRGLLAAGQAGAIKRHILEMPGDEGAHLMVKFLRGRERIEARRILRRLVADYIGVRGLNRRAVGLLLARYYGARGITMVGVAEKLAVDRRRVSQINRRVAMTLDALSYRAETRIYEELQKRGIVQ